jgi:pimeloyl-ACP methyl ester carboxylesterase
MKINIIYIIFICLAISGCSLFYPTKTPIDSIYYITGKIQSDTLIIKLPGRFDEPEDFSRAGFIKMLSDCAESPDAIVVDAHIGYYYGRNLIPRLHEDVIVPAAKRGYKNIWLMGISMGGLGALLYAQKHPETIKGVLVLAPFLGDREVIDEISNSGGLAKWVPAKPVADDDYQRQLWLWLKECTTHKKDLPALTIGWGDDDRLAEANKLLAEALPADRIFSANGGHDWDAWRELFRQFLKSNILNTSKE